MKRCFIKLMKTITLRIANSSNERFRRKLKEIQLIKNKYFCNIGNLNGVFIKLLDVLNQNLTSMDWWTDNGKNITIVGKKVNGINELTFTLKTSIIYDDAIHRSLSANPLILSHHILFVELFVYQAMISTQSSISICFI